MRTNGLTPQQLRVAALVAAAFTDKEIGAELRITRGVVNFHMKRIAQSWALDPQRNRRVQIAVKYLESIAA